MNRTTADIETRFTDTGLDAVREALAANPETPAQRAARLADAAVDERALNLAREVETLFSRSYTGGPGQRLAALQVLLGDALREADRTWRRRRRQCDKADGEREVARLREALASADEEPPAIPVQVHADLVNGLGVRALVIEYEGRVEAGVVIALGAEDLRVDSVSPRRDGRLDVRARRP